MGDEAMERKNTENNETVSPGILEGGNETEKTKSHNTESESKNEEIKIKDCREEEMLIESSEIIELQKKDLNYTSSIEQNFHLYPAYFSAALLEDTSASK